MISEESFKRFLNTLCCSGCKFFVDKNCTEENAHEHNIEKEELRMCFYDEGVEGLKDLTISTARLYMLIIKTI